MFSVLPSGQMRLSCKQFLALLLKLPLILFLHGILTAGLIGLYGGLIHALPHNFLLDVLDRYRGGLLLCVRLQMLALLEN